jgi:hypothetical protein
MKAHAPEVSPFAQLLQYQSLNRVVPTGTDFVIFESPSA